MQPFPRRRTGPRVSLMGSPTACRGGPADKGLLRLPPTSPRGPLWAWVGVGPVDPEGKGSRLSPFSKHSTVKSGCPNAPMPQCPNAQSSARASSILGQSSQQCVIVFSPSSLDSVCPFGVSPAFLLFSSPGRSPAEGTGHLRKISSGVGCQPSALPPGSILPGCRRRPYSSRQVPDLGQVIGNPRPVSACAPSRREGTEIWKLPRGEDCRVSCAHLPMSPGTELRRRVLAVQ